ncbi:chemotaxis protein CheW [Microvirga alba]|uniref:Chemotaxis protein CheW n=1 Tax=Microvirga alba TaxID=2791025 RepID=A0A931BV31_9HYPH|nr:chemotaxis protein CheW [Microvirga alba]MBF9235665.1 chemotaxis protein CheW [Microvirga alba]
MTSANANSHGTSKTVADHLEYVTVTVQGQMLGLPIDRVHDVFVAADITTVPLASSEIVGLLNLRGRVVTAVSLRRRLGIPDLVVADRRMAVGLEHRGESYGLLVDEVGEVLKLEIDGLQPNPVHLDARWAGLSRGVHQLQDRLLIILDVDAVLAFETQKQAA